MSELVDDRGLTSAIARQVDPRLEYILRPSCLYRVCFRLKARRLDRGLARCGEGMEERRDAARAAGHGLAGTAPGAVTDAALPSAHVCGGRNGSFRSPPSMVLDGADYARLFALFNRGVLPKSSWSARAREIGPPPSSLAGPRRRSRDLGEEAQRERGIHDCRSVPRAWEPRWVVAMGAPGRDLRLGRRAGAGPTSSGERGRVEAEVARRKGISRTTLQRFRRTPLSAARRPAETTAAKGPRGPKFVFRLNRSKPLPLIQRDFPRQQTHPPSLAWCASSIKAARPGRGGCGHRSPTSNGRSF